jgi:hypothetical protein
MVLALLLTAPMTAAVANVITDWDDKAVSTSLGRIGLGPIWG